MLMPYQRQVASASFLDNLAKLFSPKPSIMDGFSLYEDPIHKASIQYPSVWDKNEVFKNDYVGLVTFTIPGTLPQVTNVSDIGALKEQARELLSNPPDRVIFTVKSLPVETVPTLENVTGDQVKTLNLRGDNFRLLSTSYGIKMGEIPASKTVYTYTDSDTQKKGMQVNAVKGYKQITLEYSVIVQDFDKFLPTVYKMIDSFQLAS
jgi:hypothetical protein